MWCHIIDFLSVPFRADKAPRAIVRLFIYLLQAFFFPFLSFLDLLRHGLKRERERKKRRKIQKKGEGDDKTRSKMVAQKGTWYGQTHTQAISLITSDREGAEGNSSSHGHFHCGAPLAMCPIYAFSTHTQTHMWCTDICTQISAWSHPCMTVRERSTAEHTLRDTERENKMTWLVAVIIYSDSPPWTEPCVQ